MHHLNLQISLISLAMDKYKEIRDLKTRRKRRGGKNRQSLEEPLLSAGRAEEGETPSRLESEQSPDAPAISPFANGRAAMEPEAAPGK